MLQYLLIYYKISITKTQTCKLTILNKRIRKDGHKTVGNLKACFILKWIDKSVNSMKL